MLQDLASDSDSGISVSWDFPTEPTVSAKQKAYWETFFLKFSDDDTTTTYSLKEIPQTFESPQFETDFLECTHNVSKHGRSSEDIALIDKVEIKFNSNLKCIIIRREKSKIFINRNDYTTMNSLFQKEIDRLLDDYGLTKEEFMMYGKMCFSICQQKKRMMDEKFPQLRRLLLDRGNLSDGNTSFLDEKLWRLQFSEEWDKAKKEKVLEEDLVSYCVLLLRSFKK